MYTTMHAFHWFFQRKPLYIVYITEFSLKFGGGGANALLDPSTFFGGAMAPWPPCGGPNQSYVYDILRRFVVYSLRSTRTEYCMYDAVIR